MTNQMKKLLIAMLIYTYSCLGFGILLFCISGFSFESIVSYVYFGMQIPLAVSLQVLYNIVSRRDEEVRHKIERINTLIKLREGAKLKFYKDFGIVPKYDEKGNLLNPDDFIGIVSVLTKDGVLEPSIYELLGILPRFDKDGREIPFCVVIKHLVESFKKRDFDKLKFKTLKFKTENNKVESKEVKKVVAPQVKPAAKAEKKAKEKSKTGKPFKEKKGKSSGGGKKDDGPKGAKTSNKELVAIKSGQNNSINNINDDIKTKTNGILDSQTEVKKSLPDIEMIYDA